MKFSTKKSNKNSPENTTESKAEPMDPMLRLEEALVLCKFGKFNVRLMSAAIAACLASSMTVTATSFVIPNAECDLNLSLMQKGVVSATPFIGQIAASFFTGFLSDAFGRKFFLVWSHFCLFICTIFEGSSQSYTMLVVVKIIQGVIVTFSFNTTPAMISECTHKGARDKTVIVYSTFMSASSLVSALFAWGVLPLTLDFTLWNGFQLHSWNIYLYASSIWSGLAALQFCLLPESPKFLLAHGQTERAMEILKNIYNENTGDEKSNFPIKSLDDVVTPVDDVQKSMKNKMKEALFNSKELFRKPLIIHLTVITVMVFLILFSMSALRLWFPQISTIVENYINEHDGVSAEFCVMINDYTHNLRKLDVISPNVTSEIDTCIPKLSGAETYMNSILMGVLSIFCVLFIGSFVDCVGQKPLIIVLVLSCSSISTALYWTNSSIQIALMISVIIGFVQTTFSLINTIFVRVFPTTVRTLAMSIVMMVGRIGSLSGSILFPVMLEKGCMVPFGLLACSLIVVAVLSIFLPNTRKQNEIGDR